MCTGQRGLKLGYVSRGGPASSPPLLLHPSRYLHQGKLSLIVLEIEGRGFRGFFCFSGVHKEGKRRDFYLVRRTRVRPQWTETAVSRGLSEALNSGRPTSGSSSKRAQVITRPKARMELWNESQEAGLEGDRTHHIRAMT